MPKYYSHMIAGYYLYFTSACIVECMHVHASNKELNRNTAAKFFVMDDGDTVVQKRGNLNDRAILKIQKFIKKNYKDMYVTWSLSSQNGYYIGNKDTE